MPQLRRAPPLSPSPVHAWRAARDATPPPDDAGAADLHTTIQRARAAGHTVTRLVPAWSDLFHRLPRLGELLAQTRNDSAVHETIGAYTEPEIAADHILVHGGPVDLRVFPSEWAHGLVIAGGELPVLAFFDAHGDPVHAVHARPRTRLDELQALVDTYRAADQGLDIDLSPRPAKSPDKPDWAIDRNSLQIGWLALKDTHDFADLLRAHGVSRTQALRLAPDGHARPVAATAAAQVLRAAAGCVLPIMIFVESSGCLQIHSGPIARVVAQEPWLRVVDRDFRFGLRQEAIAQAWVVRKPTADGVVTSLELFDDAGDTIALLFGARKPGRPELAAWRELLAILPTADEPTTSPGRLEPV